MIGLATVILIVVSIIFKINHFPGAAIMMCTGIFLLLFVFLPAALVNNFRESEGNKSAPLSFITWLSCLVVFTAMLFKILHWPGAGIAIIIALPFPFVVFLPVYLVTTSKIKGFDINNTIFVLLLLSLQAVFSALLALNVSKVRIEDSMILSDHYTDRYEILQKISGLPEYQTIPESYESSLMAADRLTGTIRECKVLIGRKAGISKNEETGDRITDISVLESRDLAPVAMLSGTDPIPAVKLIEGIDSFVSELQKIDKSGDLVHLAKVLFNLNQEPGGVSWIDEMFSSRYLAWVIIDLNSLEASTSFIKHEILNMK